MSGAGLPLATSSPVTVADMDRRMKGWCRIFAAKLFRVDDVAMASGTPRATSASSSSRQPGHGAMDA